MNFYYSPIYFLLLTLPIVKSLSHFAAANRTIIWQTENGAETTNGTNNAHFRQKRQFISQGLFHCSTGFNGFACYNYQILPGTMNWFGAQNMCQQLGGTLFSPSSLEDVYYIMTAIQPYRTGTGSVNRSFWLGMACQCQFANPFGCYQCMWADGRPVSAFAQPPTSPMDPRIGTLWSNMYNRPDHFARSVNGQMCLFMTDHWALYECNFADLQGGAVCQIPTNGFGNGFFG